MIWHVTAEDRRTTLENAMLIGELADCAGVNPKTIRYYEDIGLLPPPERTAAGYRMYDDDDLDRLHFVHRAKQLDLRLEEITEVLALRDRGEEPCDFVRRVAQERLAEVKQRIAELDQIRDELSALLDRSPTGHGAARCCHLIER